MRSSSTRSRLTVRRVDLWLAKRAARVHTIGSNRLPSIAKCCIRHHGARRARRRQPRPRTADSSAHPATMSRATSGESALLSDPSQSAEHGGMLSTECLSLVPPVQLVTSAPRSSPASITVAERAPSSSTGKTSATATHAKMGHPRAELGRTPPLTPVERLPAADPAARWALSEVVRYPHRSRKDSTEGSGQIRVALQGRQLFWSR